MSTPTIPNPLMGSRAKVERAKKYIQDLNVALKSFFDSKPYGVRTKSNPKAQQLIFYISRVSEPPVDIALIAGDAIQNLRSALDYLACQLYIIGSGNPEPPTRIGFPVFDSSDKYERGKLRKVQGMRPEAIEAIDLLKPYKGGNDQIWRLHRLNNVDKHRLLIVCGSYFRSFDLSRMFEDDIRKANPDFGDIKFPPYFLKPAETLCPLKAGDELLTINNPNAESAKNVEFRFDVSLYQPQILKSEPILATLQQLIEATTAVIESFDSHTYWSP
jgi:hypothetical protein